MKNAPRSRRFLFACLLMLQVAGTAGRPCRAEVTAADLQRRIEALCEQIRAQQRADGAFGRRQWSVGQTSLAVLALRSAGVSPDDPAVQRGVSYLLSQGVGGDRGVYETSLKVMALASVDPKAYSDTIGAGARYLIRAQQLNGGWGYRLEGRTDNSNSQFAVLGLHAAAGCGVDIPTGVWEKARTYFSAGQNADGGWGYGVGWGKSYGSMTAAGVASLYICDLWLHVKRGRCGVYADQRRIADGLSWLARNFTLTRNPGHQHWHGYYLYGLERAGVILARRYFGRHDWYREGVEYLVGSGDQALRSDVSEWPLLKYCFVLLFLAKGNAPLLMQKAEWNGGWSSFIYDARFLTEHVGRRLGQELDWQIVPLDAPLEELMKAPILYVSGRGPAAWSRAQSGRLKQYLDAGGFVLVEAAGGDRAFDSSFRTWMKEHLPDQALEPLPKDHPLYSCYYDLPADRRPPLEAVKGPCWVSLLYAPRGLGCAWDIADHESPDFKLGVNIAAYVTGMQKLHGKLVSPRYTVPPERPAARRRGAFTMGQLVHGQDWQPHKVAWRKVLQMVNKKAGIEVYGTPIPIDPERESPFQAQMLYITGVDELELSERARAALKLYLKRGGFIFVEAACGSPRFDRSFRELMRQMFPERKLTPMPVGHPLFELGEPLGQVHYSPAVRKQLPGLSRPVLEFIEQDGRAVIVYSKYDISSAIDGHPCFSCPSVLEPSASGIALKVVLYGLSS